MAELRPYNPTWRDRLAQALMGDNKPSPERRNLIAGMLGSTGLGTTGVGLADVVPGGQILGAQEAMQDGDYKGAAMAMMPLPAAGKLGQVAKPIKAYHGSPHSFDRFDLSKAGSNTDPGSLGKGLYFSTDANVASTFPHKYEVGLKIENPLNVEMQNFGQDKRQIIGDAVGVPFDKSTNWNEWADKVAQTAKQKGHDSIVLDYSPTGYSAKEIATFDDRIIEIARKYGIPVGVAASLYGAAQPNDAMAQPAPMSGLFGLGAQ